MLRMFDRWKEPLICNKILTDYYVGGQIYHKCRGHIGVHRNYISEIPGMSDF